MIVGKRWTTLPVVLACAALSLAATPRPAKVDAMKLGCAQFRELGPNLQKRVLSFLQGYAKRGVSEDNVGSVAIGGGLSRVLDACLHDAGALVAAKVFEVSAGQDTGARGEALLTRPPLLMTCRDYAKLSREDQRLTVYWLDGYSRKDDPTDLDQSTVALNRDPEQAASKACGKREQRLWWTIQGAVRSVGPTPPAEEGGAPQ